MYLWKVGEKYLKQNYFNIFVDEGEEKFKDPGSCSDAGVSLVERHNADFSLVDKSLVLPSDWSEPDQPVAGFKRTAQFSGECFLWLDDKQFLLSEEKYDSLSLSLSHLHLG